MILQTDTRLNSAINEGGCNFMAILYHVVMHKGIRVDTQFITYLYNNAVEDEIMKANCYIYDYDKLFHFFGLETKYTGIHEKPSRRCAMNEIENLCFYNPGTGHTHFVAGDGCGNVAYDPLGKSITVRDGYLKSKRIFKIL